MISAIGPFWDANETWLVLAVGLLLVAFPAAPGVILTALYLPVFRFQINRYRLVLHFHFKLSFTAGQQQSRAPNPPRDLLHLQSQSKGGSYHPALLRQHALRRLAGNESYWQDE